MLKKILLTIFFIFIVTQSAFSAEVFKITSVNFDTSNSLIFINSPDNTSEEIMKQVKVIKLQNPKRIYFDINSAVLNTGTQNWFLNSGGIKQVKINQFSANPGKVRVVLYLDEKFNTSAISYLKVNNNIVIKYKDAMPQQSYYQNTYRDEKTLSSDYYENLTISNIEIQKVKTANNQTANDPIFNEIQQSFTSTSTPKAAIVPVSAEVIKKDIKLKSKYYLDLITPKKDGFLVSGFGTAGLEKPMYLTNPARVSFDVSNVIVNPDVKNKDFTIGTDTLRVNQIESNKARIVITSPDLDKYFPIYSADGQSMLFVKTEKVDLTALFNKTNDALGYDAIRESNGLDDFIITFNSPVIHSIKRDPTKLTINFYNTLRFNEPTFKYSVKNSNFENMTIDLLPKVGLKLVLPLPKETNVRCYLGADGKAVKITLKGLPPKAICADKAVSNVTNVVLPKCKGKRTVVLDAGHGGHDYGAIRSGINEKDINLDIVKRVQAILVSKNVSVALTRNNDEFISLPDRTSFCASSEPDIFISIHVNSSAKPEINGIETHYYQPQSMELANVVHACVISDVKAKDRGIFKSKFYVINHTEVPAILVEIGFLSNNQERAELVSEERKQQTAKAICEGILKYLNSK